MTSRIDEINARLAAATPGEWKYESKSSGWSRPLVIVESKELIWPGQSGIWPNGIRKTPIVGYDDDRAEDIRFCAAAPSDIAYLLAEVERLEKLNSYQYEAAKRGECPSCGFDNVKILEGR